MNFLRMIVKRIGLGLITVWAVLTTVFALFTLTEDWAFRGVEASLRFSGGSEEEIELAQRQYLAERGLDRPITEQYVEWMERMLTLNWGESFMTGEPALTLVISAVSRTAMYVLPALLIGIAFGTLVGLYAGLNPDGRLANWGLGSVYLLFALPNFWLGGLLFSTVRGGESPMSYSPLLFEHVLPIALVTTTLIGGYASYSRAHSLEYASADFVALVKAKGAGRFRIACHVVRNAAIPLFSMLFTEAFALLILAVFVIETLFGIEGFGLLLMNAAHGQDIPVLLGGTVVIIGLGVLGNIVQDLSYSLLDPRVDMERR
ncbi:ABC transporter permease [Halalkalicoccus subterraneus]|uniref:ABC transporter permease n=1 Tax=Halalkalicoccus subterraneus TaxID=2675002 RepID=UPI000EFC35FC|nr:ABC transporter permease [Halalkalicoccus subterraneus]